MASSVDLELKPGSPPPRVVLFSRAAGFAVAAGFFLLAGLIAGVVVEGGAGEGLRGVGLVLAGCMGLVGFIMYLVARRRQRVVNAMAAGDYHVHWVYSAQEWQNHIRAERSRLRRHARLFALIFAVTAGIFLFIGFQAEGMTGLELGLLTAISAGGMFLLGYAIGAFMQICELVALRHQALHGGEAFISRLGLFIAGAYWPWRGSGVYLLHTVLERKPDAQLRFTFHIVAKHSYNQDVIVPVPYGREDDLLILVREMEISSKTDEQ